MAEALEAVFRGLLKAVLEMKKKASMFKQTLIDLGSTLVGIAPVIKEIEQHNNDLGRPKEELESLIKKMQEGTKLVYECSKVRRYNYFAKIRYQDKLAALGDSLVKFFVIDMQAQTARDQKETLLKVRRMYSAFNKLPFVNREDTRVSSSDSAGKVMEPITGTKQEAAQSKAKAGNNQGMKHLVNEKSYDQLPTERATCIVQNNVFYAEDDKTSYNEQVHANKPVYFSDHLNRPNLRTSAELLGEGSYGATYKVTLYLKDGSATEAWKWFSDVKVSQTEFTQQMEILQTSLPEHPNVCPLRGYYCSSADKLLIYDYIAGGSFSALIHGSWENARTQLDWNSKMKISLGAARGIAHIHSVWGKNFVHGNIKSSNVLVIEDFQGCISDFGLTLLDPPVIPCGTKGYQAPEVIATGKWTQKSDVYSFGILLLEMLTGKSPEEDPDLASWVEHQAMDGLSYALFDDAMKDDIEVGDMGLQMMRLARACASRVPNTRPKMDEVVRKMEMITSN